MCAKRSAKRSLLIDSFHVKRENPRWESARIPSPWARTPSLSFTKTRRHLRLQDQAALPPGAACEPGRRLKTRIGLSSVKLEGDSVLSSGTGVPLRGSIAAPPPRIICSCARPFTQRADVLVDVDRDPGKNHDARDGESQVASRSARSGRDEIGPSFLLFPHSSEDNHYRRRTLSWGRKHYHQCKLAVGVNHGAHYESQ
jgi:hypothetical protein